MENLKEVSIIIPVCNVRKYILRCLDSVAAQSFSSIECWLVDDCGNDDSIKIAEKFVNEYHGSIAFHIIHHQTNQGPSAARNMGVSVANGKYVFFLDSDDAITPDCIEVLYALMQKYPNADFAQGNLVEGTGVLRTSTHKSSVPEYTDDHKSLENIILLQTNRTAWNKLIRRTFLMSHNIAFPEGLLMEDHLWTYLMAKHARAAAYTAKGTYFYYRNEGNIVTSTSKDIRKKRYQSYMETIDIINDDLQHRDIQPCHHIYVGEVIYFIMRDLSKLHSLSHWGIFWHWTFCFLRHPNSSQSKQWRMLMCCMMPPLCFLMAFASWRWRLRHYIIGRL